MTATVFTVKSGLSVAIPTMTLIFIAIRPVKIYEF